MRKLSFFSRQNFCLFFCTCHCFCMQKLSFVSKNEFIPDVQFRVIANLLFLAFFDNFCSNCPRMICIDARTTTSISSSSVYVVLKFESQSVHFFWLNWSNYQNIHDIRWQSKHIVPRYFLPLLFDCWQRATSRINRVVSNCWDLTFSKLPTKNMSRSRSDLH